MAESNRTNNQRQSREFYKEDICMKPKGYYTWNAYMGYVPSANTY